MSITKESLAAFAAQLTVDDRVLMRFTGPHGGTLKNRHGEPVSVPLADPPGSTTIAPGCATFVASGVATFKGTKRGRGKGGSLLLRFELSPGTEVAFGTPEAGSIMRLEKVGDPNVFVGYASEDDMPMSHPPRPELAGRFKNACMTIIPLSENRPTIQITAPRKPSLNGLWRVTAARRHVGRHGQIQLSLMDESTGRTTEFWSYRDSGVVDSLSINN